MATFKQARGPTKFLIVEEIASIFADQKSVDLLSEVSSCESPDESFWESSAADSASELESETETEYSQVVRPQKSILIVWSVLRIPTVMICHLLRK